METRFLSLLSFLLLFLFNEASAQDTIFFNNESVLVAKISLVDTKEIKYKKLKNPNGPTYSLAKSEISKITYANGSVDTFDADEEPAVDIVNPLFNKLPSDVSPLNTDVIITKNGKGIYCAIKMADNSRIRYQIFRRGADPVNTIPLENVLEYRYRGVIKKVNLSSTTTNTSTDDTDDDFVYEERRRYGGPRIGLTTIGPGAFSDVLNYDGNRTTYTQFGWQFETRMFTTKEGLSGMLEVVPMIGGMDMGTIIPSISGLIGLRTKNGIEFGLGPTLALYVSQNTSSSSLGVVIAAGMSIKSGKVNFPINLAFVPSISKKKDVFNPTTGNYESKTYDTGFKLSLLIGFNYRKH